MRVGLRGSGQLLPGTGASGTKEKIFSKSEKTMWRMAVRAAGGQGGSWGPRRR